MRWHRLAAQRAADLGVPLSALRKARPGWASPLLAPGRVLCLPGARRCPATKPARRSPSGTETFLQRGIFMSSAALAAASTAAVAAPESEAAAIEACARDCIEGWYAGDAARMERSLHPELAKRIVRACPMAAASCRAWARWTWCSPRGPGPASPRRASAPT
ncbi:nuclear transport factor 2 family protein [Roseateles sp.]|uniref:nuclear transport factor 2 family protein n=1 Tax=Roseateles sp. TaxID=1971397 RepID=UPI00345D5B01